MKKQYFNIKKNKNNLESDRLIGNPHIKRLIIIFYVCGLIRKFEPSSISF